ncbi:MAG TPA: hypothetical protein VN873_02755 [Candidatus Angelobacter sp.]|nr:hypothetical protein [Candidatus Angelobacter sp.]
MTKLIPFLVLVAAVRVKAINVTNEINAIFNETSYDAAQFSPPSYKYGGDYFATYFYSVYPQYTNHIYSWGRSGSSLQQDYEEMEERVLPLISSFAVPGYDFVLANDNGGYASNGVVQWMTNIYAAPPLFWNGVAVTNEGDVALPLTLCPLGCIPDGNFNSDSMAIGRNAACTNLASLYGVPVVDMRNFLFTNGLSTNALFGYFTGGHPFPAGHLVMTIFQLASLGFETNIGNVTFDWGDSLAFADHCVVAGMSVSTNSLRATVRWDRMPFAWDVPDGTITNDARGAFTMMPSLANWFRWTLQVTNLPSGTYNVFIDNSNVVTLTSTQLAAGWNMFTNYTGPLWDQRKAVLKAKRDQEGIDSVTLLEHSAGSKGVLGVYDLANYGSFVSQQYVQGGKRGAAYVAGMAPILADVQLYDVAIHDVAQQTNHTIMIAPAGSTNPPGRLSPPTGLRIIPAQ